MPAPATVDRSDGHRHATALAALGFRVLPIRHGMKHPPMAAWQEAATAEQRTVDNWWNGLYRDCGVGIATGRMADGRRFFVLDIDDREHVNGTDALHALEQEHGKLPDTVTSITGSNGSHLFLAVPDGRPTPRNDQSGKIAAGIDVRGDGGQVVVAPTIHPSGQAYAWDAERSPSKIAMAEAPTWLMDLLEPPAPAEPAPPRQPATTTPYTSPLGPADRFNETTTWPALLEPDGWKLSHERDGEQYWTRPGKDTREGVSATIGWQGNDALKVFTSGVAWLTAEATYSKFQYFAARHHSGDYRAAARAFLDIENPPLRVVPVGEAPEVDEEAAPSAYDADLLAQLVVWPEFWTKDLTEAQWIAEPVIAEGRAHAIYAPGGTGKSLFALWLAAAVAVGKQGLDSEPMQRRRVLYLDYEMTQDDLRERLASMGYDDTDDLSWLSYALLPSLPPADAPEGGKAIARMAQLVDAELVVIDTFSRAVSGDENDADTVRSFYRWTGLHLKAEGRAFIRIDHAGKDIEKGQRGSSAKNDDVDVVWQMTKAEGGFKLVAKKRRMGWVPESFALMQLDAPLLHYRIVEDIAPAGTDAVVADLDEMKVPPSLSARKAEQMLREADRGARGVVVRAAQKARMRRTFLPVDNSPKVRPEGRDAPRDAPLGDAPGRTSGRTPPEMPSDQVRTHFGTRRDAPPDASGTRPPSLKGDAPSVTPNSDAATISPFDDPDLF